MGDVICHVGLGVGAILQHVDDGMLITVEHTYSEDPTLVTVRRALPGGAPDRRYRRQTMRLPRRVWELIARGSCAA